MASEHREWKKQPRLYSQDYVVGKKRFWLTHSIVWVTGIAFGYYLAGVLL